MKRNKSFSLYCVIIFIVLVGNKTLAQTSENGGPVGSKNDNNTILDYTNQNPEPINPQNDTYSNTETNTINKSQDTSNDMGNNANGSANEGGANSNTNANDLNTKQIKNDINCDPKTGTYIDNMGREVPCNPEHNTVTYPGTECNPGTIDYTLTGGELPCKSSSGNTTPPVWDTSGTNKSNPTSPDLRNTSAPPTPVNTEPNPAPLPPPPPPVVKPVIVVPASPPAQP